jgi:hypothetical protein
MCYINYHWNNTKIKSIQSKLFQCLFYTNKALNLGHLVKVLWKHLNNTNTKGSPLCDGPFLVFSQSTFLFIKKTKSRSPSPPPNKLGVCPFFLLVHWPPILKHLNVSYTKSSSKWIWSKNMVKPTLFKMSV